MQDSFPSPHSSEAASGPFSPVFDPFQFGEGTVGYQQSQKIRVGMVLDQAFPPDARVEREAMALIEAGFEVHLLCLLPESKSVKMPGSVEEEPPAFPREEIYQGIHIHRVQPTRVRYEIPILKIKTRLPYIGLLKSLNHSLRNRDTAWLSLIDRFVHCYGIQILHIHDLRLVDTALAVSKRLNIPLVADFHENYPALMQILKGKKDSQRGMLQREKWEKIELRGALAADRVITVVEEARDRLIRKDIPASKISVVPNTVDITKFTQTTTSASHLRRFKSCFVLTYVGHLNNSHRGIQTVIQAMGLLRQEIPELFFLAAGALREPYHKELTALAIEHGVDDRIYYSGWLDETEFVPYIEAADICLCPHVANDHTHTTFPNKVYLYHLLKKPIIVSSCEPLKRYVTDTQGGLWFESENPEDMAAKIRQLYNDTALRRMLAEQGQNAVRFHYNWTQSAPVLVSMYQGLARELGQVPQPAYAG